MSWVCAQVSMNRAVSEDAALMAGPNHGTRSPGSSPANVPSSIARAPSNQARTCAPLRSRYRAASASGSMAAPGACIAASSAANSSGRMADLTAISSK